MATLAAPAARRAVPQIQPARTTAVLVGGCDGYPAGTAGTVTGSRQGCLVFAPHDHSGVARWAHPREEILVPPALLVLSR